MRRRAVTIWTAIDGLFFVLGTAAAGWLVWLTIDELQLVIYPVTLGSGKKLFARGTMPVAFTMIDGAVTPGGVVFARYARGGEIVTGHVGPE